MTAPDVYVGLRLNRANDNEKALHITLTFVQAASSDDMARAWLLYTNMFVTRLPLAVQLVEKIKVGQDKDMDAYRVSLGDAEFEAELQKAYDSTVRRENNAFPQLLLHMTVDTDEKKRALASMGGSPVAETLYLSIAGGSKRVLAELRQNWQTAE